MTHFLKDHLAPVWRIDGGEGVGEGRFENRETELVVLPENLENTEQTRATSQVDSVHCEGEGNGDSG